MTASNQQSGQPQGATGKPLDRVDGTLKVTGGARYAAEIPLAGVVHGALFQSAIAKGRIKSIDTREAMRAPGVIAVITHVNAPKLGRPSQRPAGESFPILQGPEIAYSGQHIGIVVADTLERAEHAAKLVHVSYEQQTPSADIKPLLNTAFSPTSGVNGKPAQSTRGNPEAGLQAAAARVEQTYTTPFYHHNALEPHATIATWNGDNLLCYNATQNVNANRQVLAEAFGVTMEQVRVVNHFVGGGFGSKGMSWPHTVIAAVASRMVNRPVKLAITREQMYFSNGHRPTTVQQVALGASADGKLTSVRHDTISHTSMHDEFVEPSGVMTEMLYSCANVEVSHKLVRLDVGTPTYTRAPGEASGSFALESAMDELAYALKMDPLELRLRNYAEMDEGEKKPFSSKSLRQCYQQGAEKFGWSRRNPAIGSMRDGRYLVGWGMATATYPANFRASSARALMMSDGSVVVRSATHDLGTGTYTVFSQVAADAMGVPVSRVRLEIADTRFPEATGAGGSSTAGSVGSAVQAACNALRNRLIGMATTDRDAPLAGTPAKQVDVAGGRIFDKQNPSRGETYAQLMARRKERVLEAQATAQPGGERGQSGGGSSQGDTKGKGGGGSGSEHEGQGQGQSYSFHGFGAQFVEVKVDPDLKIVKVSRAVGVFANGRILNAKTAHSQFVGGMVWGIGMGLLEQTHMDTRYARYTNSNFAEYLVPVNADIPDLDISFIEEEDKYVNPLGVKGVGEIGIVGTAAAIANAVYHATGQRVRDLPVTIDKLL